MAPSTWVAAPLILPHKNARDAVGFASALWPRARCALCAFLATHSAVFPSPLWGGVRGGGRSVGQRQYFTASPPSPTLPHKGGGSRPRSRGRTDSHCISVAHSGSAVHSRASGNPGTTARNSGVPAFAGTNGANYFAGTSGKKFDYIATTLLTTYRAYAKRDAASLVEGVF
jgi:hypothetical protein